MPFEEGTQGDGVSGTVGGRLREGSGECVWGSDDFGGDWGECTVTRGGDLVGDLGGEKATIEVGRGLGLLHGAPVARPRGVRVPLPV